MPMGQDAVSPKLISAASWKRQWVILSVFVRLLVYLGWDYCWDRSSRRRQRRAHWFVQQLLALGPTFIKIGQALSTRGDLLPLEYVQALSQLQDRVPALSAAEVIAVIESELGQPIDALYQDFARIPLAAASLGQVHKAQLHTGETVVIKIQRPGLAQLFEADFAVLHRLVRWGDRYLPGLRKYNLEARYQEFFALLYREIDYIHEGQNADRFRVNFQANPQVLVPKVYWRYSNRKVLTLEYLPGTKIDDRQQLVAQRIDPEGIIELGICCYLKQLLLDGFFQSDPHPGNMAVSQQGHLIFYDFGTMTEVKAIAKDQMIKTFFAVMRKDSETVVETLVYMGLIEPMEDMTPIKRLITFILEQFTEKPLDFSDFQHVSEEVYWLFKEQPFRLPEEMTFVLKSLTTLDGIARSLNPNYNLMAASRPFVKTVAVSEGQSHLWRIVKEQLSRIAQPSLPRPGQMRQKLRQLESRLADSEQRLRRQSLVHERQLKRVQLGLKGLTYACLMGFSALMASTVTVTAAAPWQGLLWVIAGICGLQLLRTLFSRYRQARLTRPRS